MNIFRILKEMGFDTVPESFYSYIDVWKSWYDGNVRGFHDYRVFNGQNHVQCRRYTLGMGKKVCEDWANLLMNEKVKITLEGQLEQEFFNSVCQSNNFDVKINEMQELKAAYGTAAYVVRIQNANLKKDGQTFGGEIRLDYVLAKNIFPLTWENGMISECAFTSESTVDGEKYVYLQIHRKYEKDGTYIIENSLYLNQNGTLKKVPMNSIKGFENVPEFVNTGSRDRMFVIDRLNIANNVDHTLPLGVPAIANAIDQLKGVDIAYDSYVNEFVLGKKRIMVKPGAVKDLDGNPVFDPNELTYYVLPEDTTDGNIIVPIDMQLRTAEHNAGLQDMLNALSSRCGFGENHYKFENGSVATATQVISENSNLFRTIKKHEIILESALIELCRIILRLGNSALKLGLNEEVEISIDFDDSIIEDKQVEFNRTMQLLSAGLMRPDEARAMLMNEDIDTARSALPGMEEMADEEQDEVE